MTDPTPTKTPAGHIRERAEQAASLLRGITDPDAADPASKLARPLTGTTGKLFNIAAELVATRGSDGAADYLIAPSDHILLDPQIARRAVVELAVALVDELGSHAMTLSSFEICTEASGERESELRAEAEQLRYERQLLGHARRILDDVASESSAAFDRHRPAACDIAQRIVDEIGHPGTDEPALGPDMRSRIAELETEVEGLRRAARERTTGDVPA